MNGPVILIKYRTIWQNMENMIASLATEPAEVFDNDRHIDDSDDDGDSSVIELDYALNWIMNMQ